LGWHEAAHIKNEPFISGLVFLFFDLRASVLQDTDMLILCSGPDTFYATKKALELEQVFKKKYDADGNSVEYLHGKDAPDQLLQKINTVSLFSPRRFLRMRNLIQDGTRAKLAYIAKALVKEPENIIVVSVEEKVPTASALKLFAEQNVKLVSYDSPVRKNPAFTQAISLLSKELQIQDQAFVRKIGSVYEGDTWAAWGALLQAAAGASVDELLQKDGTSVFDRADLFLTRDEHRHAALADSTKAKDIINILLSQSRSALRVRDGSGQGIHPFVQKKLARAKLQNTEKVFGEALLGYMLLRRGWCMDDEAAELLS